MTSFILQTATRLLQPLMLFFSVFLLIRGHNQPGGGFVGGLVAAAAYGLQSIAFGVGMVRATLRIDPRSLVGWGLLLSLVAALVPLPLGKPLFTSLWARIHLSGVGAVDLGSPLVFDLGVYLVVAGATLCVLFALEEE